MLADDLREITHRKLREQILEHPQGTETLRQANNSLMAASRAGLTSIYQTDPDAPADWDLQKKLARYFNCQGLSVRKILYRGRDGLVPVFLLSWAQPILDHDGTVLEE